MDVEWIGLKRSESEVRSIMTVRQLVFRLLLGTRTEVKVEPWVVLLVILKRCKFKILTEGPRH